jgi:hypothetical protein
LVSYTAVKTVNISGRVWSEAKLKWFLDPGVVAGGWGARW